MTEAVLTVGELQQALDKLNLDTEEEWTLINGKLHKKYQFKNFIQAFGFMTKVAIQAEVLNHHPEWSNVYRTVIVDLVTHDSSGVTALDFQLARKMDQLAT